jgi:3-dehydroquinate synthase
MIGAFHQPCAVVIDLSTLDTLPTREYAAGLAEVIKYGASLDAVFFAWLEQSMPSLMTRDRAALGYAIRRACELKAEVVGSDERESGRRALLNFGHTFGHAIEGASGYGSWLHGEAVAAGMVMAASLSSRLGLIDDALRRRLIALLIAAGLPVAPPRLSIADWRRWMSTDKKAEHGRLRFVVMDGLGASKVTQVEDADLEAVLAEGLSGSAQPTMVDLAVRA